MTQFWKCYVIVKHTKLVIINSPIFIRSEIRIHFNMNKYCFNEGEKNLFLDADYYDLQYKR